MVTDEERDYMYSEYAKDPRMKINVGIRRRLAPLLDAGRDEIELLHAILFSLPGSPVLYYGDEIMMGDNVYLGDRDGVRTPMQWTSDRNGGFSRADFAQLYAPPLMDPVYGFQAVNVEAQMRTPYSLLRWLRRFIALRKEHPVFGLGMYEPLAPSNRRIFAHVRTYEGDMMLCVHNLARSAQAVELDLSSYEGYSPVEMFGRSRFPQIGELPYLLTLAPRGFYWFQLVKQDETDDSTSRSSTSRRSTTGSSRSAGSPPRPARVTQIEIVDRVTLRAESAGAGAVPGRGALPGRHARDLPGPARPAPGGRAGTRAVIIEADGWTVYDALADPAAGRELLHRMRSNSEFQSGQDEFIFRWAPTAGAGLGGTVDVRPVGVEQSNSSIVFGDELIMKAFRKVEPGVNPELELLRFLTAHGFPHIASLAGWYEVEGRLIDATLGILQEFLAGARDGWELALDELASDAGAACSTASRRSAS